MDVFRTDNLHHNRGQNSKWLIFSFYHEF